MGDVDGEPEKYDPLNETSGEGYRRTQAIAKHLSIRSPASYGMLTLFISSLDRRPMRR